MIPRCLARGVGASSKHPALTTLLWLINAGMGLLASIPAWTLWRDSFSFAPSADTLLSGFNFAVYGDIGHYNRTSIGALLTAPVAAMAAVAGILGALVFGGILEILRSSDSRPFMHRFFRGAGHFYWRFLRLSIYTAVAAVVVTLLLSAALAPVLKPLDESAWEPGWVAAFAIRFVAIGAVLLFFFLALDYARIRVAAGDTRRAFRAWIASLGFVLRHLPGTFGIAIAFALLFGILLAAYLGYSATAPSGTWRWILLLIFVQQVVVWLRAGLRVGCVAAEVEFFERSRAARQAATQAVTAPMAPGQSLREPGPPGESGPVTAQAAEPTQTAAPHETQPQP